MAVTIGSVLGGALIVDVIDTNFAEVEDLLKERLTSAEFKDTDFDRYIIRRWTGGRITSTTTQAREILDANIHHSKSRDAAEWDVSGWRQLHDFPFTTLPGYGFKVSMRELLGSPGRSFMYDFQEDGYSKTGVTPDAISSSNVEFEDQSEPHHECHSWWLTVPHGSVRQWVPEPCIAMVWADFSVLGAANKAHTMNVGTSWFPTDPTASPDDTFEPSGTVGLGLRHGDSLMFRTGLFVDHNPCPDSEGTDYEFTNTNPNIVRPSTAGAYHGGIPGIGQPVGGMNPTRSWDKITDKGIKISCRTRDRLRGVIPLDGNRYYNFSLKHRDGWYRGLKFNYTGGSHTSGEWSQMLWDLDTQNSELGYRGFAGSSRYVLGHPLLDVWWEHVSIHVEFFYGRDLVTDDFSNAEFTTVPV